MESAGRGVAEHVLETGSSGKRVLVICGSGNNGGDGFVAARHMAKEARVEVLLLRSRDHIHDEISRGNLRRAEEVGVPITLVNGFLEEKVGEAEVVVDAMLGVGVSGAPRGVYAEAVQALNASGKRVVSVDIPSGWGTELAVQPESTVTFHAPKVGMGPECGRIVIRPIGVPEDAVRFAGPGELTLVPVVPGDAHKGMRGNVLVVGGGPYTGAPTLAALAAHRCGADLVYAVVPGAIANVVRGFSTDLIVRAVGTGATDKLNPTHIDAVMAAEDRSHAVVIGPGLGDDSDSIELAAEAFRRFAAAGKPVVVDADGLKAFKAMTEVPMHPGAVLTPHGGEFTALYGSPMPKELDARIAAVKELAVSLGCVVLSKGEVDVVSDGTRVKLNDSGNAAMATGGTGDVLSGAVGAFLAKGMDAFDAARAAAFLVGAAGDEALAGKGHSLLASDLLETLPLVFARHLFWWTRR
jgi:NAD(P)H-hydrate epimerase